MVASILYAPNNPVKISPANLIRSKFGDQCKTVTVSSTLKTVYQFDQITFFSIRSKSIQLIETIFLEHAFCLCTHDLLLSYPLLDASCHTQKLTVKPPSAPMRNKLEGVT